MDLTKIETLAKELPNLSISKIAMIIAINWKETSKTGIYFGAKPYLNAMAVMQSVNDNYGADSGKSIILYFLSNATTWKGEVARLVKKELNKRIK
nr:hypothetical protein [uncultured Flavobacterium sp.]